MNIDYKNHNYDIKHPDRCPHCHNGIEPQLLTYKTGIGFGGTNCIYTIWNCVFRDCINMFITVHQFLGKGDTYFIGYLDGNPIGPHWPETILKLESKFINTYNQALKAENEGLNELAGMGYRKSIEYLVKDYLINNEPTLKGNIEDKALAKIIGDNFNDVRESDLKDLLLRATWLGNDMTHYLQYHINFDIIDLKELIKLVMDEIHSIEQKRHYISSIESKYK